MNLELPCRSGNKTMSATTEALHVPTTNHDTLQPSSLLPQPNQERHHSGFCGNHFLTFIYGFIT